MIEERKIKIKNMKRIFHTFIVSILMISCGGEGIPANTPASSTTINQTTNNVDAEPQKLVCNHLTKKNFDKWYKDPLGRCPFKSYKLENVVFEGTITKGEGQLESYELKYVYHPDSNWPECKHTLTFVLYDLYKTYSNDELKAMVGKTVTIYAPKVEYMPFKTENLSNCGLWASIEVYSGWKFVNKGDFDLVEPERNPYFLN